MKRSTLLFHIIVLLSISCYGQQTKVFVLDLGTPNPFNFCPKQIDSTSNKTNENCAKSEPRLIDTNQLLQLELINANPYKYRYEIDSTPIDLFVDSQSEFNEHIEKTTPVKANPKSKDQNTASKVEEEITRQITKNEVSMKSTQDLYNTGKAKIDVFKSGITNLEEEINKLIQQNEILSDQSKMLSGIQLSAEISKTIGQGENIISEKTTLLNELKSKLEQEEKLILKNRNRYSQLRIQNENLKKDLINLKRLVNDGKRASDEQIFAIARSQILLHSESMKTLDKSITNYLLIISTEDHLDAEKTKSDRLEFMEKYNHIFQAMNDYTVSIDKQLTPKNTEAFNELLKTNFTPIAQNTYQSISKLFSLKLENYSLPLDFDGKNIDLVKFKLKIIPLLDKSAKSAEYEYNVWVKGGLKLDVSAGIFLSNLTNNEYTIRTIMNENNGDTEEFQVINKKNLGSFEYGLGTVANLSYRTGRWAKPTLSFGAMFTNDQKFQFLTGGGLILGKMSRFILHYGISIGRVTTIQDPFISDGTTKYEFSSDDEVPTVDELKIGQFFGITYNLGRTKSQSSSIK